MNYRKNKKMKKNILILTVFLISLSSCGIFDKKIKYSKKNITYENKVKSSSLLIDGIKQKMIGNKQEAYEYFFKATEKNPYNGAALYELAKIYFENNEFNNALEYINKAIEIEPKNLWYKQLLADTYIATRNYNSAIKVYDNLIQENPKNLNYLYELARIYLLKNEYIQAINVYDKIEKIIGIDEAISQQKKNIYLFLNKPQKAINEIQNLINAFPDDIKYQNMLGELYIEIGQTTKALNTFLKIKQQNPYEPNVDFYLHEIYFNLGKKDSAYYYLKNAFYNPNNNIDKKVLVLLAYYDKPINDSIAKKESYELSEILIKTHPNEAKAHSIYADILYKDKKIKEAKEAYRRVIELDSSRYIVWEQLLNIELTLKDYNSLINEATRAIEMFPEQPLPYYFAGYGYFELKNYTKSIYYYKAGLNYITTSSPLIIQFYNSIADAYYYLNDYDNAFSYYEKSLTINPNNATTLNNYAYYLALQGLKLDKAKEMAEKANKLTPNSPSLQDTYAWIFYKLGEYETAKSWLEKALENGGDKDPTILEHYGDVLYKMGNINQALEIWKKANSLGKGSDLLNKKIQDSKLYE